MKKIYNFLKTSNKTLKKKRQLINTFKYKLSIDKLKPKIIVISTLDYFGEK